MYKASISLACEFLATFLQILSGTFAQHSCECRENFHVSQTRRELVVKVLNMCKNFMQIFSQNISQDCRAMVIQWLRDICVSVANLSLRNFGEFTKRKFHDTRTMVAPQS